jgi:hypothetical protein
VTTTRTTNGTGDTGDWGPIIGVLSSLLLIAALAYLVWRHDETIPGPGTPDGEDGPPPDDSGVPDTESGDETAGGQLLLSDEERVLDLLEERGGRMKQTEIVEETDWSNAKVSQLLSEMDENGEIEKLRLGRENLITLPEETPEGAE